MWVDVLRKCMKCTVSPTTSRPNIGRQSVTLLGFGTNGLAEGLVRIGWILVCKRFVDRIEFSASYRLKVLAFTCG